MTGTSETPSNDPTSPPAQSKSKDTARAGKEASSAATTPFDMLSKYISFPTLDQEQWWKATGPLLSRILAASGYPLDQQYQYLTFHHAQIVPRLGPYPARWISGVTRSGLPIEFSMNYQQHGGGDPMVRIGLEPVDSYSGTGRDPFNQAPAADLLHALARLGIKGFDPQLYSLFAAEHTLTPSDIAAVKDTLLKSQHTFGFDFKDSGIVVKGYTFPGARAKARGVPIWDLIADTVTHVRDATTTTTTNDSKGNQLDCTDAFSLIRDYVSSKPDLYHDFTLFSWDYIDPAASRLKYYCVSSDTTWARVEELWSLGGRAQSTAHTQGLPYLRKLWEILELQEGARRFWGEGSYSDDRVEEQHHAPMTWNYEMRGGEKVPLTKCYFPLYGMNDAACVGRIARFFEWMGWAERARAFAGVVRGFYPDLDISKTARLILWVSFAYTEKSGVYLSVYFHPSLDYDERKK
ncbi:tryptophan dimethylallyltransferase-domain-containing protein [Aspergillus pseudodeflectus]|uniref:Tryptophan dimethylallyltransferase-domain-containing protein n=1 Tax=Aspergillus pseudodeflectus TaxID=176178 RepID=A0ABR4L380_9EURO